MLTLLSDPNPDVRVAAISGVCRTISVFWLILPSTFLSQAMHTLVKDLAFDASSPKVRVAVLKGTSIFLSSVIRCLLI